MVVSTDMPSLTASNMAFRSSAGTAISSFTCGNNMGGAWICACGTDGVDTAAAGATAAGAAGAGWVAATVGVAGVAGLAVRGVGAALVGVGAGDCGLAGVPAAAAPAAGGRTAAALRALMVAMRFGSGRMLRAALTPADTDCRNVFSFVTASLLPTRLVGFSTSGRFNRGFGRPSRALKMMISRAWFAIRLRSCVRVSGLLVRLWRARHDEHGQEGSDLQQAGCCAPSG